MQLRNRLQDYLQGCLKDREGGLQDYLQGCLQDDPKGGLQDYLKSVCKTGKAIYTITMIAR